VRDYLPLAEERGGLQQMQVLLRKVQFLHFGIPPDYTTATVPDFAGTWVNPRQSCKTMFSSEL